MSLVRSRVTDGISIRCQCDFPERLIYQSALFCNEPDSAVFRAMMFSSAVYSDVAGLVEFIEDWVQDGISIDDGVVMFDIEFLTTDSPLSNLECAEPSLSPTPTDSTAPINDTIIIAVAVVGIVLIAVLLFVVVIVVCRCAMRKRKLGSPSRKLVLVTIYPNYPFFHCGTYFRTVLVI